MTWRALLAAGALLGLAGPALAVPAAAQDLRPAQLRDVALDPRPGEQLPIDLPFLDSTGAEVRLADYLGERPMILALVYYECPMLCTLVGQGLVSSLSVLEFDVGREFDVVAVSIDPGETPDLAAGKKASYAARYQRPGTVDGWHFLTGKESSIRPLAEALGFRYTYDAEQDLYGHAAAIHVVTPDGRLSRTFSGVDYPARDLRLSLVEASEGGIGSVIDQVLLFCYPYDPTTQQYSLAILRVVRVAGILTVLALVSFFVIMRRRETRRLRGATS